MEQSLICSTDPTHRKVLFLPGVHVRESFLILVQPSDYHPLLMFSADRDKTEGRVPRVIQRDFRALGYLVKGVGAEVIFSSKFLKC